MRWPWVSRRVVTALEAVLADQQKSIVALQADLAQSKIALKIRTEDVGLAKGAREAELQAAKEVAIGADAILDSIERVDGLYVTRNAGETWREYRQRILMAFKEGADGTLYKAVLDEIGRFERDAFVRATGEPSTAKLQRLMGGVDMARTLKARLAGLAGRHDMLLRREVERRQRTEMAFSDEEDGILAREVVDGRIPRR